MAADEPGTALRGTVDDRGVGRQAAVVPVQRERVDRHGERAPEFNRNAFPREGLALFHPADGLARFPDGSERFSGAAVLPVTPALRVNMQNRLRLTRPGQHGKHGRRKQYRPLMTHFTPLPFQRSLPKTAIAKLRKRSFSLQGSLQ